MADRKPMDRRRALRITAVAGVSVALGGALTKAALRSARLHRIRETRTAMGTVVTITIVHPDDEAAQAIVSRTFGEMERLENILSRHRPGTAVHQLNAAGQLIDAPNELIQVLELAAEHSIATNGAFDITVSPLLELYARSFEVSQSPPAPALVRDALGLVDFRQVHVNGRTVRFADPRMNVTLDGIAKGYIVDRASSVLIQDGAERVLVNAGGDMMAAGDNASDEPWSVAIQDPFDAEQPIELIGLAEQSVATSGDYMRAFSEDRRFHHIIDPRTGYSPDVTSSATVVAHRAVTADALSTAALVMGPDEGLRRLDAIDGVEAMLVTKTGQSLHTRDWERATHRV